MNQEMNDREQDMATHRPSAARAATISMFVLAASAGAALAGKADVVDATIGPAGDGTWRVAATVRHADEGWDHYADQWQVIGPEGAVPGTRELHHPHENEQPFTRSLSGVRIPDHVKRVEIRARDSVHGHGGETIVLDVPR